MSRIVRFRRATKADVSTLLDLTAEYYREERYSFDRLAASAAVSGLIRDPRRGSAWLVVAEGRAVGYFLVTFGWSLEYRGRDAFVDEIYLTPEHRGRGVGSKALAYAERAAAAAGARALHLEVERFNVAARDLYRRRGFTDRGRILLTKLLGSASRGGAAAASPRARALRKRRSTRRGPSSRRS
jgi:GNAT superfamily N-acetyltransferase